MKMDENRGAIFIRESKINFSFSVFAFGKDLSLLDRPVRYQLVGRVMAYQGNDA